MGLLILNSYIYARYKAMGLVDYNKYTITNAIERDVELPTIGGFIPVVSDRFTVDTSTDVPIYKSYMIGSGTVLTCDKNQTTRTRTMQTTIRKPKPVFVSCTQNRATCCIRTDSQSMQTESQKNPRPMRNSEQKRTGHLHSITKTSVWD